MNPVHPDSMGDTLDALNSVFLLGCKLDRAERERTARWIAGRQGLPGAYAGMPAPTPQDFEAGLTTFTGEKLRSRGGAAHILGEEACRALILLRVRLPEVRSALVRATAGIEQRLADIERSGKPAGMYCCGICTCAYWRHLAAGGPSRNEERRAAGMKALRAHRLDTGRWRRFPFFYTLLALIEIAPDLAGSELRHAAPVCERYVRTRLADTRYAMRRRWIAQRVLALA